VVQPSSLRYQPKAHLRGSRLYDGGESLFKSVHDVNDIHL
jgi:hypothetical protein